MRSLAAAGAAAAIIMLATLGAGVAPAGAQEADSPIAPIEDQQITFTEGSGKLPFTIDNVGGQPLDVVVQLRSSKLEFPQGSDLHVTLPPGPTNLEVSIEARASGSSPLEVEVLSADGTTLLAAGRFTVRSTAISGLGLLLSVSAGLFLLMWWVKHFHGVRRDRRLVSLNHPTLYNQDPDERFDGAPGDPATGRDEGS